MVFALILLIFHQDKAKNIKNRPKSSRPPKNPINFWKFLDFSPRKSHRDFCHFFSFPGGYPGFGSDRPFLTPKLVGKFPLFGHFFAIF